MKRLWVFLLAVAIAFALGVGLAFGLAALKTYVQVTVVSNLLTLQSPATRSLEVAPGDSTNFIVSLKNISTGVVPFQFYLNDVAAGWSVYIAGATDYRYTLAPGDARDFIWTLAVPATEQEGATGTFTISADDPM